MVPAYSEREQTLQANFLSSSLRPVGIFLNMYPLELRIQKPSICDWFIAALLTGSYARRLRDNHSIRIRRYKEWYGIARGAIRCRYDNTMYPSRIVA